MLKYLAILHLSALFISCSDRTETNDPEQPNIILIMADDLGFSDIGIYGGEVHTPNIDALAKKGLRYTQFYNNARCCPSRASLMTGLYPHQAGMGWMTAADLGTPAYQGELNNQSVTQAEVLKSAGYTTYMSGKWHLSRVRNIKSNVKDQWPKQRGFDHYFGIIDGASNYFTPTVFSGNNAYQAPDGFYITHAISDSTVRFIQEHEASGKENPFFIYVSYTSPHWPLHALEKDIARYKEVYEKGWDELRKSRLRKQMELGLFDTSVELSERDSEVPAWNDLSAKEQEEFAMRMAIYAAQIDAMDQGIGRIVNKLKETGQLDNTIIYFLSDNGACAEFISRDSNQPVTGQADTWESYRINWANLSSTPFKEYKHWIHEGGIATPLIVHWPDGIKNPGAYIREPGHLNDIMATNVELAGATYPEEYNGYKIVPMQGQSLVPHFSGKRNHRKKIFWEHEANIGVRDGKWKLVAKTPVHEAFDPGRLELYNLEEDPSELNDLSDEMSERVSQLYGAWEAWAERVNVKMDTRDYGQRERAYQRQINGDFAESLAGWQLATESNVEFVWDEKESALIIFNESGEAQMAWPFIVKNEDVLKLTASVSASGEGTITLKVVDSKGKEIASETTQITDGLSTRLSIKEITDRPGGTVQFIINLKAPKGTSIWVDNVSLF